MDWIQWKNGLHFYSTEHKRFHNCSFSATHTRTNILLRALSCFSPCAVSLDAFSKKWDLKCNHTLWKMRSVWKSSLLWLQSNGWLFNKWLNISTQFFFLLSFTLSFQRHHSDLLVMVLRFAISNRTQRIIGKTRSVQIFALYCMFTLIVVIHTDVLL